MLPTAILLPPIYVALVPIPYIMVIQLFVYRGVFYRAIFTIATISLSYVLASVAFRWFPASFAGGAVGSGLHAFTWVVAVTTCYVMASRIQHFMIVGALKLSNPKRRIHRGARRSLGDEIVEGSIDRRDLGDDSDSALGAHRYSDSSRRRSSTRVVCSQVKPWSLRPKWP